jgi:hypothetical protein
VSPNGHLLVAGCGSEAYIMSISDGQTQVAKGKGTEREREKLTFYVANTNGTCW